MAVKTIETRAIISAQDQTGATFSQVAQKLKQVENAAQKASTTVATATRASALAGSINDKTLLASGAALRAAGLESFVTGAATALAGGAAAHEMIRAGSERVHETLRMQAAGMSADELKRATLDAAKIATEFPSIKQTDVMHMLRNARSIVGGYEEAAEIIEDMSKLRVVTQAARPGADVTEELDLLLKGIEIKGATQDRKQFHEYMNGIARGINAFGDTLKPYQYYEMFKYGRLATPGLSEKFILSVAPTLAQEMGGSSFGKAVSGLNQALIGGVMKHSSLQDMQSLGLIANEDLLYTKTGEAKGLKPGRHVKGWEVAQNNPYEWVQQFYLPALKAAGAVTKDAIYERISRDFQNATVAQLIGILATQSQRIEKDAELVSKAKGLESAKEFQEKDPREAWNSLKNSLDNLGAHISSSFLSTMGPTFVDLAKAINAFNERWHKDEQDPKAAVKSQRDFNRILNNVVLGVDSSESVPDISQEDWAKGMGYSGPRERWRDAQKKVVELKTANDSAPWYERPLNSFRLSNLELEERGAAHDYETYRGQKFAHRRKLRAQGRVADINNRVAATREFEDRVSNHFPTAIPGLLGFSLGGYKDIPDVVSEGVGQRRLMSLPKSIGFAEAGVNGERERPQVELKGAADIVTRIEVSPAPDFMVKVRQDIQTNGDLRNDVGVTMPMGR
jgi:hypothetical protein